MYAAWCGRLFWVIDMNRNLSLGFSPEKVVDNFAGGGGASTGIELALGRSVDIAINHDGEALAMHQANHPDTAHYREDVFNVHPGFVTGQQPIGLAWFSPDCKHHSKAKGGKPREQKIRGLAWITLKWAAFQAPRCIMLENVEEFGDWGPIDTNGKPIKSEKGRTFKAFIAALSTGLSKDHADLQEIYDTLGADFPIHRLYEGLGYKVEWRVLRACDYGTPTIRKRLFLIARRDGLPIVWPSPTHGDPKTEAVKSGKLQPWRTAAECIDFDDLGTSIFGRNKALAINTQRRVAKGLWRLVLNSDAPFIVGNTNAIAPFLTEHANSSSQRNMPINEPLRTVCAQVKGGHFSVVAPILTTLRGTGESNLIGRSITAPLSTISAGGTHHSLIGANLTPIDSVRYSGNQSAVVSAFLEQANGGFYEGDGHPANAPMSTITATGSNQRLVTAYLVKYYGSGGQWQSLYEPMHTIPTKERMGLVQVVQIPASSIAPEHLERAKQCAMLLHEYLPEQFPSQVDVIIVGDYVLVDITIRMLKARELARAQGLPNSYILDPVYTTVTKKGKRISYRLSKKAQVRMIGNSVCPPLAQALVTANFAHEKQLLAA